MTKRAIILAAGKGERLVNGLPFPKPLKRVGGVPLLVRVLRNLERAGVEEAYVVVGHQREVLERGVTRYPFGIDVQFIHNPRFAEADGLSVLAAAEAITGPTLLVMGDHLAAPELVAGLQGAEVGPGEVTLAVDLDPARALDGDSTLGVRLHGDQVVEVSTGLPHPDGLVAGAMCVTPALVDELRSRPAEDCTLAGALDALAARGKVQAASVGSAMWIDVDTRAAHAFAERSLARYGEALQPTPMVAGL